MYDFLDGEVVERRPGRLVVAVGGIGYEISTPLGTSERLGPAAAARVYVHCQTSSDGGSRLYGFSERRARDLFRRLLDVSGVGPSTALSLLSQFTPEDLARILASGDAQALRRARGVGEKTAQRIAIELRGRLPAADEGPPGLAEQAIAALVSIGYSPREADAAVADARERAPGADLEALVRAALGSAPPSRL